MIEQLVEVAERSLSPSLNATYTALACIDWLGAALAKLSQKDFPSPYHFDENGRLRLFFARPLTMEGVIDAAFNQIRQSAHDNVAVRIRLLEMIALLLEDVEDDPAKQALLRQASMIEDAQGSHQPARGDQIDMKQRYEKIINNGKNGRT